MIKYLKNSWFNGLISFKIKKVGLNFTLTLNIQF